MTFRTASIALFLALSAFSAQAQETGRTPKGDPLDDILNPSALSGGNGSNSGSGGAVLDAGARGGQGSPATGQTGVTPSSPAEADILAGTTSTPPPGDATEMEWAFAQERVEVPPADVKGQIDERVRTEIAEPAERFGNELVQLNRRAQQGPQEAQAATREAVRLAGESDGEFPDLSTVPGVVDGASGEVDDVATLASGGEVGPDGRPVSGTTPGAGRGSVWDNWNSSYSGYGYNDPSGVYSSNGYRPIRQPAAGTPDSRMSWWQSLLLKSLEGVAEGLKGLSERRANELRARNERIRREYPNYRAYVDVESRRAIERSAFARAGGSSRSYDRRLDDLILGPARGSGSPASTSSSAGLDVSTPGVSSDIRSNTRPVARLPRVTDPVTGEERIVIDMPLGVDAVRPIR